MSGPVPPSRSSTAAGRRTWRVVGGGGLVVGSGLELVEVLLFSWADARGVAEDWFVLNSVLLVAAGLVIAAAALALAFGGRRRGGSAGIVGTSVPGKVALVAFAAAQLAAKVVTCLYFDIPEDRGGLGLAVSGLAVTVAFVAVIVAATVVARAGVARGAARWSLFAIVAVGPLTAVAVTVSTALELTMNVVAVLVQAGVGLTYLRAPEVPIREQSVSDPRGGER